MTLQEFQSWLMSEGIQPDFRRLISLAAAAEIPNLSRDQMLQASAKNIDWRRLILAAGFLARSDVRSEQEASLRIATGSVTLQTSEAIRDAGGVLLAKLGNGRSVELAQSREQLKPELEKRLGPLGRMEDARRSAENTILVESTGELLSANRFQIAFWEGARKGIAWVSASAPTAAGKTYIVLRWLLDQVASSKVNIAIYVAPTRALVSEIEENLRTLAKDKIELFVVSSLPLKALYDSAIERKQKTVFVLTQERLHLLANSLGGKVVIDLLVVDEAHKVGDHLRGVVLQDAIERLVRANSSLQAMFVSPSTQNPAALLADAPHGTNCLAVDSDVPTVLQNLITADQINGDSQQYSLALRHQGADIPLGIIRLPHRPSGIRKRIAFLASATVPDGGTLVYANGAAEAEEIAYLIAEILREKDEVNSQELNGLAELSRKGVHRSFFWEEL
jgi:hypothetical protein